MKRAGLKKKKVEVNNIPARAEQRVEEFKNSITSLDGKLDDII
jgi:hypothetical protein